MFVEFVKCDRCGCTSTPLNLRRGMRGRRLEFVAGQTCTKGIRGMWFCSCIVCLYITVIEVWWGGFYGCRYSLCFRSHRVRGSYLWYRNFLEMEYYQTYVEDAEVYMWILPHNVVQVRGVKQCVWNNMFFSIVGVDLCLSRECYMLKNDLGECERHCMQRRKPIPGCMRPMIGLVRSWTSWSVLWQGYQGWVPQWGLTWAWIQCPQLCHLPNSAPFTYCATQGECSCGVDRYWYPRVASVMARAHESCSWGVRRRECLTDCKAGEEWSSHAPSVGVADLPLCDLGHKGVQIKRARKITSTTWGGPNGEGGRGPGSQRIEVHNFYYYSTTSVDFLIRGTTDTHHIMLHYVDHRRCWSTNCLWRFS